MLTYPSYLLSIEALAVYPIKAVYTSNIPVILASALLANAIFMGQMLWDQIITSKY